VDKKVQKIDVELKKITEVARSTEHLAKVSKEKVE
jgi:hypothetical protein